MNNLKPVNWTGLKDLYFFCKKLEDTEEKYEISNYEFKFLSQTILREIFTKKLMVYVINLFMEKLAINDYSKAIFEYLEEAADTLIKPIKLAETMNNNLFVSLHLYGDLLREFASQYKTKNLLLILKNLEDCNCKRELLKIYYEREAQDNEETILRHVTQNQTLSRRTPNKNNCKVIHKS